VVVDADFSESVTWRVGLRADLRWMVRTFSALSEPGMGAVVVFLERMGCGGWGSLGRVYYAKSVNVRGRTHKDERIDT
jgi:hypothetical protein